MDYAAQTLPAAGLGESRVAFIRSAYSHLAVALLAFVAVSGLLYVSGVGDAMLKFIVAHRWSWFALVGGVMVVGWIASRLADNAESNTTQLAALAGYVLAESLLFAPIFAFAALFVPKAIPAAGFITVLLVAGLTYTAFTTKKDFSFLGGILTIAGFCALGAIVASIVFGFSLGIWFSALMVVFAGGCVLYDTSNIIHHYPTDRPAGAALHLFASIALMLWYVLQILLSLASSDD